MSGKPKDPNRTYHPNWGGAHPGGQKPGRKPLPYTLRQLTVAVLDDAEYKALRQAVPNTRQRVEILMSGLEELERLLEKEMAENEELWQQSK